MMTLPGLRSSVRPIVTMLLAITFCAGFWAEKVSSDQFVAVATLGIGFWFGSRTGITSR